MGPAADGRVLLETKHRRKQTGFQHLIDCTQELAQLDDLKRNQALRGAESSSLVFLRACTPAGCQAVLSVRERVYALVFDNVLGLFGFY